MADLATLAVKVDLRELNDLTKKLDQVIDKSGKTDKSTKSLTSSFLGMNKATALVVSGAAAMTAGIAASVVVFSDLESRLVGVQKTTDFTAKEMALFRGEVERMGRSLPVSTAELYNIAGAAGQLGIKGVDNISAFTETMAKLSLATDVVGDEGAQNVARLLNVLGEAPSQVTKFGDVLVALGNNSAATESQILHLATQVGQATSTFAVTSADAAAMGAAMASLGVSAELGGSVVGRAMRAMEAAINEGGTATQNLSAITGVAAEDLRAAFGEDTTGLFEKFVTGLGQTIKSGTSAADALSTFGLKGEEVLKVLPTMAQNSDILSRSLEIANDQMERGGALNAEVGKATETLSSQWGILKNIVTEYAFAIGEDLSPVIKDIIKSVRDWHEANGQVAKFELKTAIDFVVESAKDLWDVISQIDDTVIITFGIVYTEIEKLKKNFDIVSLSIKSSFALAFDGVTELAAKLSFDMADLFANIPVVGEELAKGLEESGHQYRYSSGAAEEYKMKLDEIEASYQKNVAIIEKTTLSLLDNDDIIGKNTSSTEKLTAATVNHAEKATEANQKTEKEIKVLTEEEIKAREAATKAAEKALQVQSSLREKLTEKIIDLTQSELDSRLYALDKEVEGMMEMAGTNKELIDDVWKYYEAKNKQIIQDEEKKNDTLTSLREDLSDGIKKMTTSDLEYQLWALDEQIKKARETAGEDEYIQGQLTEFHKLKRAEIVEDHRNTEVQIYGITLDYGDLIKDANQSIVDAFIQGESVKTALAQVSSNALSNFAVEAATRGLTPILEALGQQIGAWVGLGEAKSVTDGDTWWSMIASGAGYLAAAGGAILAAKALGNNFANGGWIGANPGGGMIRSGSWAKDDVFLGMTGGTINMGMGGEYVINQEATRANLPLLEYVNTKGKGKRLFASGGPVSDGMVNNATDDLTRSGVSVIGTALIGSIFDLGASLTDILGYYGGAALGMIAGKEVGENLFADGGQLGVRNFSAGGLITEAVNVLLGLFGWSTKDIWEALVKLPGIPDYWEMLYDATLPFVRDTATPGEHIDENTFKDAIDAFINDFAENFLLDAITSFIPGGQFVKGLLEDPLDAVKEIGENVVNEVENFLDDAFGISFNQGGLLGSYQDGTSFVPATGPYMLHQGEAVIPANQNLNNNIEIKQALSQIVKYVKSTSDTLRKFDFDGLPETRPA